MNAIAQHFMRKDGATTVGAEKVSNVLIKTQRRKDGKL